MKENPSVTQNKYNPKQDLGSCLNCTSTTNYKQITLLTTDLHEMFQNFLTKNITLNFEEPLSLQQIKDTNNVSSVHYL